MQLLVGRLVVKVDACRLVTAHSDGGAKFILNDFEEVICIQWNTRDLWRVSAESGEFIRFTHLVEFGMHSRSYAELSHLLTHGRYESGHWFIAVNINCNSILRV